MSACRYDRGSARWRPVLRLKCYGWRCHSPPSDEMRARPKDFRFAAATVSEGLAQGGGKTGRFHRSPEASSHANLSGTSRFSVCTMNTVQNAPDFLLIRIDGWPGSLLRRSPGRGSWLSSAPSTPLGCRRGNNSLTEYCQMDPIAGTTNRSPSSVRALGLAV